MAEQTTENAHASHPEQLLRHAGILRTLPLTVPGVTALPSDLGVLANAGSGVDGDRLLDDQTFVDQLADVLARVSVGNLVGVEPDPLFAALHDASRFCNLSELILHELKEKKRIMESIMVIRIDQ